MESIGLSHSVTAEVQTTVTEVISLTTKVKSLLAEFKLVNQIHVIEVFVSDSFDSRQPPCGEISRNSDWLRLTSTELHWRFDCWQAFSESFSVKGFHKRIAPVPIGFQSKSSPSVIMSTIWVKWLCIMDKESIHTLWNLNMFMRNIRQGSWCVALCVSKLLTNHPVSSTLVHSTDRELSNLDSYNWWRAIRFPLQFLRLMRSIQRTSKEIQLKRLRVARSHRMRWSGEVFHMPRAREQSKRFSKLEFTIRFRKWKRNLPHLWSLGRSQATGIALNHSKLGYPIRYPIRRTEAFECARKCRIQTSAEKSFARR